ncbi:hypothetical protein V2J09_023207 [Rumex salicifolius]
METITTACSKESPAMMKSNQANFNCDEDVDSGLELGLGLSLGSGGGGGGAVKFLTAQDLPSVSPHGHSRAQAQGRQQLGAISGNKRAADRDVVTSSSPPAQSQVVGWPPIRTSRINNLASQNRATNAEDGKMNECGNKKFNNGTDSKAKTSVVQESAHLGFVKVNMDGVQIGRKVDLRAHSSYDSLAQMIEDMFFRASISGEKDKPGKLSKLLDGSSEFVLTYEDKEGDWMLVGDVPFRMFQGTVKRLRIMRTSEANGLAYLQPATILYIVRVPKYLNGYIIDLQNYDTPKQPQKQQQRRQMGLIQNLQFTIATKCN